MQTKKTISKVKLSSESIFLDIFLNDLDLKNIKYCIERNYEHYPNKITGDVDIIILPSDLEKILKILLINAKKLKWKEFLVYKNENASYVGFFKDDVKNRFVIAFEFFCGGVYKGLEFLSPTKILKKRELHKKVWKPCDSHELILTLFHHLLYNGKVYSKYRKKIIRLYNVSKQDFFHEIKKILSFKLSNKIIFLLEKQDWSELEKISSSIRQSFIFNSFLNKPLKSIYNIFKLYSARKKKPTGIFISFFGKSDSIVKIANNFIEQAVKWHIYIPPRREIVDLKSKNLKREVKKIINSGGVAVSVNKSSVIGMPSLINVTNFVEVELNDCIVIKRRNNNFEKKLQKFNINSHNLWYEILNSNK